MPQPPLLRRLDRTRRAEQGVGPEAEFVGAVHRTRALPGKILAGGDQRVSPLLLLAEKAVEKALADAEHRYHDGPRLHLLDQPLEHERAVGHSFAARARDVADAGERALRLVIE